MFSLRTYHGALVVVLWSACLLCRGHTMLVQARYLEEPQLMLLNFCNEELRALVVVCCALTTFEWMSSSDSESDIVGILEAVHCFLLLYRLPVDEPT